MGTAANPAERQGLENGEPPTITPADALTDPASPEVPATTRPFPPEVAWNVPPSSIDPMLPSTRQAIATPTSSFPFTSKAVAVNVADSPSRRWRDCGTRTMRTTAPG